jgi:NADPH:quinone reductase-like Zn-dependent oxidoreductase
MPNLLYLANLFIVCNGEYGHHKTVGSDNSNLIPCSDMCGTIISIGPEAKRWKTGDRVLSIFNQTHLTGQVKEENMTSGLGLPLQGVLSEYRVFPEYGLVKVPGYLSDEDACTLAIAGVTAWMSINWIRPIGDPFIGPEYTVLLQGTGGVSIAGLQIAKACGMNCKRSHRCKWNFQQAKSNPGIITSSSDKKLEQARALGADHCINYKTNPDWQIKVLDIMEHKGVDFVLETGGALTLSKSFECVAFGGSIAAVGYLSGKEDVEGSRMNTNVLALKRNVTLKGILNGPRDRFEEMLHLYEKNGIKPIVDKTFGFDQARDALLYLESGGHFGKVVVKVAGWIVVR